MDEPFGQFLRRYSAGRGSIREFAKRANIAPGTWVKALRSKVPEEITPAKLDRIAAVFGMTADFLIRKWKGETGADALYRVLEALGTSEPDEWMRKLATFLQWNQESGAKLIAEIDAASRIGATSAA